MFSIDGAAIGWTVIVTALFCGAVLLTVWRVGQWLLRRERAWNDALGQIMAATVQRRNREQTLGIILEQSVKTLGADSGTLHRTCGVGTEYELAQAVNVDRLDWLARVPADDTLVDRVRTSSGPALSEAGRLGARWQALDVGREGGVAALPLRAYGLMVLAWPSAQIAERHLPAMQAIQRYAEQVLAEFVELEARAADIQALSDALNHHERLSRTAAHDLANKLAAADSLLELAVEGEASGSLATHLVEQAKEQLSLSRPLLDELSDPERQIELEPLHVEELIRLAAAMVARRRREAGFTFTVDVEPGLPAVWGERLAVLRIFDNLLSNSIKHNAQQPDLRVWLSVWMEGDNIVFAVDDNGAGISGQSRSQLFDFGIRTDGTGKVRGHGLGLWSSRRLVEAMGGRIWAPTDQRQGASFCFKLAAVVTSGASEGPTCIEDASPVSKVAT